MPFLMPPVPALQISVFSSGTTKGIAQTKGAQVIGRGELAFGPVYVGGYLKNVTAATWDGEAGAFIGLRTKFNGFNLAASATLRRAIDPRPGTDAIAVDLAALIGHPIGKITPSVSIIYTPDEIGPVKRSIYAEAGATYALPKHFSASAFVGRRHRINGLDYTAWNAGVSWSPVKQLQFDARYWDTDATSQWPYKARFVVSGSLRF